MLGVGATEFATPGDFLQHVQLTYQDFFFATAEAYAEKTKRRHSYGFDRFIRPRMDTEALDANGFEYSLKTVLPKLVDCLPVATRKSLERECAIGCLDHAAVNARCFRSPSKFYAIVLHTGLMLLTSKLVTLFLASAYPEGIGYCSQTYPRKPTKEELKGYMASLSSFYKATGMVHGPLIVFEDEELHTHAGAMTAFVDAFVLAHEIAHFAYGHLENEGSFGPDDYFPELEVFKGNQRHEDEVKADAFAFEVMRDFVRRSLNLEPSRSILYNILHIVFAGLYLTVGSRGTSSHPAPLVRLCFLMTRYFGISPASLTDALETRGSVSHLVYES